MRHSCSVFLSFPETSEVRIPPFFCSPPALTDLTGTTKKTLSSAAIFLGVAVGNIVGPYGRCP